MNPAEATNMPNGLMLSARNKQCSEPTAPSARFLTSMAFLSQNPALAAVVWWLAVDCLGWLAFPLTFVVFRGLPDRGYALARILSLLLISYFGWLMASLRHGCPIRAARCCWGCCWWDWSACWLLGRRRREIAHFVRHNLAYIGIVELLASGAVPGSDRHPPGQPGCVGCDLGRRKTDGFVLFHGRSQIHHLPPYDPWFAGGYINYYYYGFVFVGALTKLLGIVPAIAYNLICRCSSASPAWVSSPLLTIWLTWSRVGTAGCQRH